MENHGNLLFSPQSRHSLSPVAVEFINKGERDTSTYGTFGLIKDDRDKLYGVTGAHCLPGFNGKSVEQRPTDAYQVRNEYVGDLGEKVLAEFDDKQEIDIAVFEINKHFKQSIRPDGLAEKETIPVYTGELGDLMGTSVSKLGATTGYTEGEVVDIQSDQIFIISDKNEHFAECGDSGALVTADVKCKKFAVGLVQKGQMVCDFYQKGSSTFSNVVICVSLSKSLQAISDNFGELLLCPTHITCYPCIGAGNILTNQTPLDQGICCKISEKRSSDQDIRPCPICDFSTLLYGQELDVDALLKERKVHCSENDTALGDSFQERKIDFDNSFFEQMVVDIDKNDCSKTFPVTDVIWRPNYYDNSFFCLVDPFFLSPRSTTLINLDYQYFFSDDASKWSIESASGSSLSNLHDLDQDSSFDEGNSDSDGIQ